MAPTSPQKGDDDESIRLTLSAVVAEALLGRKKADRDFPPASLHREVAVFAQTRRAGEVSVERMLVELKRIITESTTRLDSEDARRLMDELVAGAIEAYYTDR